MSESKSLLMRASEIRSVPRELMRAQLAIVDDVAWELEKAAERIPECGIVGCERLGSHIHKAEGPASAIGKI